MTYHLADDIVTTAKARQAAEKKTDGDIDFPGYEALWDEHLETDPVVQLIVRVAGGDVVRAIPAPATAGLHRVAWDLRGPAPDPVSLTKPEFVMPWDTDPQGPLLPAGDYTVELVATRPGQAVEVLAGPEPVQVVDVPGVGQSDTEFADATASLARAVAGAAKEIETARDRLKHLRAAMAAAVGADAELYGDVDAVARRIEELAARLTGDPIRQKLEEPFAPSIKDLVDRVAHFSWFTTSGPTTTQREALERATDEFAPVREGLDGALGELAAVTRAVDDAGGTWTPR